MNTITVINIAKDFSKYPAGRYLTDGPYSGERFRDEFLRPILNENKRAVINFNGARGYGSSFLEESFGGLVRAGFSKETVLNSFDLQADDKTLILEIKEYINDCE